MAGTAATFSATATGSAPLSYQWQLNGANLANGGRISGARTNTLSVTSVQPADAGSYTLVVSNAAGVVTSAAATLTVISPPAITAQPVSQSVAAGSNASFSVTASGTLPLSYQWLLNGTNLSRRQPVQRFRQPDAVHPQRAGDQCGQLFGRGHQCGRLGHQHGCRPDGDRAGKLPAAPAWPGRLVAGRRERERHCRHQQRHPARRRDGQRRGRGRAGLQFQRHEQLCSDSRLAGTSAGQSHDRGLGAVQLPGLRRRRAARPPGDQYLVFKQNSRSGDFEGYDLEQDARYER